MCVNVNIKILNNTPFSLRYIHTTNITELFYFNILVDLHRKENSYCFGKSFRSSFLTL